MGARLSQPRSPAGTTESPQPVRAPPPPTPANPFPRRINSRTALAPIAAFTMACLLFVYARTSIRAAKHNAQKHRDADTGGEGVSLLRESRRRHGVEGRVGGAESGRGGVVGELAREVWRGEAQGDEGKGARRGAGEGDERLDRLKGGRRRGKTDKDAEGVD